MKTTIYDISKATGFSPSTVSRALNNSGYCDPATKEIIVIAAKELNYRPSNAGRALKLKRSNRVLFCIPDILNPFYFEMIRGTTEYLDENSYYSMLCYTQHDKQKELKFLNLLSEQYGDGLIMVSFDFNEELVEHIRKTDSPVVTTNNVPSRKKDDTFDSVYIDHTQAMYIATEHLIELGHKNIAVIIGNPSEQTTQERFKGFASCMSENNLDYHEDNIFYGNYTIDSGKALAREIVQRNERRDLPFTGIVSSNDLMSMGVVSTLQQHGYSIPKDFSIVSLDNTDYADAIHPGLTSVDMKQYQLGQISSQLLIEKIEGKRSGASVIRLEPRLVVRESTRKII